VVTSMPAWRVAASGWHATAAQVSRTRSIPRSSALTGSWKYVASDRRSHTCPLVANPFHRDGRVYEEKCDGFRAVAYQDGGHVRLVSRNARDLTHRFPELAAGWGASGPPAEPGRRGG
jgi:ATP-dependent DNA ligase